MTPRTKAVDLSSIWLFSTCSSKELRTIRTALDELTVPAGKILAEAGSVGREFFIIVEGRAAVERSGHHVVTLGPGDYFGELALLDRGLRSASVTAVTELRILVLAQREFNAVLETSPSVMRKLLAVLATRLRETDARAFD
jgi:CRP/FNR family cyclic AMP-dependent transcriptional regulator